MRGWYSRSAKFQRATRAHIAFAFEHERVREQKGNRNIAAGARKNCQVSRANARLSMQEHRRESADACKLPRLNVYV
ncbi:hypothetical protein PV325_008625 [Microctonus aethiopoides]|nr:hypothetical protein PV325_008625 [Microctonus aethiopoides]